MTNLETNFNAANSNNPISNIVAKLYVLLKTPEDDPLMIMGSPKIDPSFVIKIPHGQSKKEALRQVKKKMSLNENYDATIMLCDVSDEWSYKTTNTINTRFDVMDVIAKQLHEAQETGKISMRSNQSVRQLNAA